MTNGAGTCDVLDVDHDGVVTRAEAHCYDLHGANVCKEFDIPGADFRRYDPATFFNNKTRHEPGNALASSRTRLLAPERDC